MLPLQISQEPKEFNIKVRMKGNLWIVNNPNNRKYPAYWTAFLPDIAKHCDQICSYYNIYLEPNCGVETIDHFKPKSKYRDLVYDWENYRYCCLEANRKKHTYEDVIDPTTLPLEVGKHTFEIDFSDGSVRANPALSDEHIRAVNRTVERLKMNNIKFKESRMDYLYLFLTNEITRDFLRSRSPFVYSEAKRQNLL